MPSNASPSSCSCDNILNRESPSADSWQTLLFTVVSELLLIIGWAHNKPAQESILLICLLTSKLSSWCSLLPSGAPSLFTEEENAWQMRHEFYWRVILSAYEGTCPLSLFPPLPPPPQLSISSSLPPYLPLSLWLRIFLWHLTVSQTESIGVVSIPSRMLCSDPFSNGEWQVIVSLISF